MTIQAYQTLYESSVAYGMRKALQAEQRQSESLLKLRSLEDNIEELEQEVDDLKSQIRRELQKEKNDLERGEDDHISETNAINHDLDQQKKEVEKLLLNYGA